VAGTHPRFPAHGKGVRTRDDAKAWAQRLESELKAHRERGGARAEVGTITLRELTERFLADPTIRQLKWREDLKQLLSEWVAEYAGLNTNQRSDNLCLSSAPV